MAKAIVDYAALYRVPCFRMQSRTFTVPGASGKTRPMFVGEWTDQFGQVHRKGMADFLLTPRIETGVYTSIHPPGSFPVKFRPCVALWVECKAGSGRLTADQLLFREYILWTGADYLLIDNQPELLLNWFNDHGVLRND